MAVAKKTIRTSHADIAVSETSGEATPVLLIHGNSSCKEVFRNQTDGPLGESYRMIAVDLPGHGESSDASDPERTYSMPGYADAVVEVLEALGTKNVIVYGWSLGGHVALEMLPRHPGIVGVMITGAPPVSPTPESLQGAFKPNPQLMLFGKPDFTEAEAEAVAQANYGSAADAVLRQAVKRTDGRARALMFASLFSGGVADQRELAVNSHVPIAVVNGADDPVVNLDYVASLPYRNLWEKHCFVLRGLGHAPFLQAPETFNPIFTRFLGDVERHAAKHGPKSKAAAA